VHGKYGKSLTAFHKRIDEGKSKAAQEAEKEFVPTKKPGRPFLIKLLGNYQIGQQADKYFGENNPLRKLANAIEFRRVSKARYLKEFTGTVQDVLAADVKFTQAQREELAELTIDATNANVNVTLPLEENKHISKNGYTDAWARKRHKELRQKFLAMTAEQQALYTQMRDFYTEQQNAMSYKVIQSILGTFEIDHDADMVARFHNNKPNEADKKAVGFHLAEQLERATELHKIEGDYFSQARRGDWVVNATFKVTTPAGATEIERGVFEFKDEKEAIAWAEQQELPTTLKRVVVDKNTGSQIVTDKDGTAVRIEDGDPDAEKRMRVTVQTQYTEFVDTEKEARQRHKELSAAGLIMKDVEPRRFERQGANAEMLGDQYLSMAKLAQDRLPAGDATQKAVKAETIKMLNEIGARFYSATRIQSSRIPSRKVAGASKDLARNLFEYADSTAGYLAKVDTANIIADQVRDAEARISVLSKLNNDFAAGIRELTNEMQDRAYNRDIAEDDGVFNKLSQRLTGIAFIDSLLSPAYSMINATQVAMFTMPYLAGDFSIVKANAAIAKAYYDLGAASMVASGAKDSVKALRFKPVTGDHFIGDAKARLNNKREQDLIDHLADFGLIDADGGMEIARILDARAKGAGGAVDKTMYYLDNVARAMPQAVEAVNRSVTALAAYRLKYKETGNHELSKKYAADVVHDTQALMSNSNAAPIFSHPVWRVSLQFKKFGQMAYYLMFKTVGRALRGTTRKERFKAAKQMVYFLGATQVVAGTAGLPFEPLKLVSLLAAALGEEWEMDDLKEWIEEQWLEVTGDEDLARGLTYGVTSIDGLTGNWGVDLNSRLGLDSLLLFGEPRSSDESDWKAWLLDTIAGPAGRTLTDAAGGAADLISGGIDGDIDLAEAAGKILPVKLLADVAKGIDGKQAGDLTEQEMILRIIGFTSDDKAAEYRETGQDIRERRRARDEYNDLISQYLEARTTAELIEARRAVNRYNRSTDGRQLSLNWLNKRRREERLQKAN